jgi:hypothetical protein
VAVAKYRFLLKLTFKSHRSAGFFAVAGYLSRYQIEKSCLAGLHGPA